MPRLSVSINPTYALARFKSELNPYGRTVRHIGAAAGANGENGRSILFHPVFVKLAAGLAVAATLTIAFALWRMFHFPH
jgi:hypothetical protein